MNPGAMMDKALRALASARLLLEAGDVDGACNRAYYAMFDAARAALAWSNINVEEVRTHNGLISVFSLHLVKTGRIPVDLGRALNRVEEIRLAADYTGGEVPVAMAQDAVEHAASFIAAIQRAFAPFGAGGKPGNGPGPV